MQLAAQPPGNATTSYLSFPLNIIVFTAMTCLVLLYFID